MKKVKMTKKDILYKILTSIYRSMLELKLSLEDEENLMNFNMSITYLESVINFLMREDTDVESIKIQPILDSFKDILKENGYTIIPKKQLPVIHPCSCGRTKMGRQYGDGKLRVHCHTCGKVGEWGKDEKEARDNWNSLFDN